MDTQNKILLGYHTKNYLPKPTPDKEEITQLLEKMNKTHETVRDRLLQERNDRLLNIIPDKDPPKSTRKNTTRTRTNPNKNTRATQRTRTTKRIERTKREQTHTIRQSR
jgi:YesN/AraC family two-component response regulator